MTWAEQDLARICEALVRFLDPFGEAVVHDVASGTIRHISGNLSNRQVGDPSFLEELDLSAQPDPVVGPYRKTGADGRLIKSISILLGDDGQDDRLLLCINMDASHLERAREALSRFLSPPRDQSENPFADDWLEKLNGFVARWSMEKKVAVKGMDPESRKRLLGAMRARSVFDRPKAAIAVAAALGVSRATIYQDLKGLGQEAERQDLSNPAPPAELAAPEEAG